METLKTYSYKFCYTAVYEEIYDSSYGTSFVFIDEDDEIYQDYDIDFDSSILPAVPAGLCKEIGVS